YAPTAQPPPRPSRKAPGSTARTSRRPANACSPPPNSPATRPGNTPRPRDSHDPHPRCPRRPPSPHTAPDLEKHPRPQGQSPSNRPQTTIYQHKVLENACTDPADSKTLSRAGSCLSLALSPTTYRVGVATLPTLNRRTVIDGTHGQPRQPVRHAARGIADHP